MSSSDRPDLGPPKSLGPSAQSFRAHGRRAWKVLGAVVGSLAFLVLAFVIFWMIVYVMADRFFSIKATVSECGSAQPIQGARVQVKLDKGVGEPDQALLTDAEGRFSIVMNEPPDAWATVVVDADGYANWTQQFKGAPADCLSICLVRVDGQGV